MVQHASSQREIITISDSSDESDEPDGEDAEVEHMAPILTFSPSAYSEEAGLRDGNESGRPLASGNGPSPDDALAQQRQTCLERIVEVFPDIALEHVRQLYEKRLAAWGVGNDPSADLILKILESGPYPKEKDIKNELKRKREHDANVNEDEKEAAAWATMQRPEVNHVYLIQARRMLSEDFPHTPLGFIDQTLRITGKNLFAAYGIIDRAERTLTDKPNPPYKRLKHPRKPTDRLDRSSPTWLQMVISQHIKTSDNDIKEELQAARKKRLKDNLKYSQEADLAAADAANEKEHRETGRMIECQCCFDDVPLNKATHCDGEEPHFFCLECAKRNASNEIGQSRYKLCCMDSSGCKAEFHRRQIIRFLDDTTLKALDRIEQRDQLRLAELEGLAHCPFCDFAAICPPVEIDREFRCHNQECEKVSCRLCKQETHIPLSCEAHAKENQSVARHAIEEAMTGALLRSCNKCKESYVKEEGCNKMVCPKCHSLQCYVCSKTIEPHEGYSHFNDTTRGGEIGRCPLFDNTAQRQQEEVQKAEEAAIAQAKADNPNINEDDLKIKVSDAVKACEERRLRRQAGPPFPLPRRQPYPARQDLPRRYRRPNEFPPLDNIGLGPVIPDLGHPMFDANANLGLEPIFAPIHYHQLGAGIDVHPALRQAFPYPVRNAGDFLGGAQPIQAQHQAPVQPLVAPPQVQAQASVPQYQPQVLPWYHDDFQARAGVQQEAGPQGQFQAELQGARQVPSVVQNFPFVPQQFQAQRPFPGPPNIANPYIQYRFPAHEAPAVEVDQAPPLPLQQRRAEARRNAQQQAVVQPGQPTNWDNGGQNLDQDEEW